MADVSLGWARQSLTKVLLVCVCGFAYLFLRSIIRSCGITVAENEINKQTLKQITEFDPTLTCKEGFVLVSDIIAPKTEQEFSRKIPHILHQSSRSRCITQPLADAVNKWKVRLEPSYSYYFHDDNAVDHLLETFNYEKFPLMKQLLDSSCVVSKTTKSDLWRYLLLWEYGGIYADFDTAPNNFTFSDKIQDHTDAYFVMEFGGFPSQYFMAVSPKHPIMFYVIQHAMWSLVKAKDTGLVNAAWSTGPHGSLKPALESFMADVNETINVKNMTAKTYVGSRNRSFVLEGEREDASNAIITREVMKAHDKLIEYEKMGMVHFKETKASGKSCIRALYQHANT